MKRGPQSDIRRAARRRGAHALAAVFGVLGATALAGPPTVALAATGPTPVGVILVRPADAVAARVVVRCDETDARTRLHKLQLACQAIDRRADRTPHLDVARQDIGRFLPGKSTAPCRAPDRVGLLITIRLTDAETSALERLGDLQRFIGAIQPDRRVTLYLDSASLAVIDPERYRAELLRRIGAAAQAAAEALQVGREIVVAGLESPVLATQLDDRNVALYLQYSLRTGAARPR